MMMMTMILESNCDSPKLTSLSVLPRIFPFNVIAGSVFSHQVELLYSKMVLLFYIHSMYGENVNCMMILFNIDA